MKNIEVSVFSIFIVLGAGVILLLKNELLAEALFALITVLLGGASFILSGQIKVGEKLTVKAFEKRTLMSIVGVIVLIYTSTDVYGFEYSNMNSRLLESPMIISSKAGESTEGKKQNQNVLLAESEYQKNALPNISSDISEDLSIELKSLAKGHYWDVEELIRENDILKERLLKLSVSYLDKELQEKITLQFSNLNYKETRELIDNFLKENRDISSNDHAKLLCQKAITFLAESNNEQAKATIEQAIELDSANVTILQEYGSVLKAYNTSLSREIEISNDIISEFLSNESFAIEINKLNVVHRGIDNPITIFLMGLPDNKIKATGEGLVKVEGLGQYVLSPGNDSLVTINIEGRLPNGEIIRKTKEFEVRDIQTPLCMINSNYGYSYVSKSNLKDSTLEVKIPDFLYALEFEIGGFSILLPDGKRIKQYGNKFNNETVRKISQYPSGSVIHVFDVIAYLQNSSKHVLRKVTPLVFEII